MVVLELLELLEFKPMRKYEDLHDYQLRGIEHAIHNRNCGLFLDMGLGKTVTTLTAINRLIYEDLELSKVLIVAPKRVVESVWDREIGEWEHVRHLKVVKIIGSERERMSAIKQKADIHIISRDNVSWLCSQFGGNMLPWDMLVIDELSSFKNHKAKRFVALKHVRRSFKRIIGLTGTPAPNGLLDLWAQMFLIDGGERLGRYFTHYRDAYFSPGKRNGTVVYSYETKDATKNEIYAKISDICLSMSAKDYLSLPERIDNTINIDMPHDLKKKYDEFEKESVLSLMTEDGTVQLSPVNAAALTNKLLQFANGFVYDDLKCAVPIHRLKIDALRDIIEEAQGASVLVAWAYQADRDLILKELKAYNPRQLKGDLDVDDWNEGKVQVMLMHPASGGHGLNLQKGGNIIVWYGNTWSLELEQQFNARLYRQGQSKPTIVNKLVTKGTVDEDVVRSLNIKDRNQNELLSALKARIAKHVSAEKII